MRDWPETEWVELVEAGKLRVGSPLIDKKTGKYAIIVSVTSDYNGGTLDRPINISGLGAYVIVESGGARRSPAIATIATHTGLRP